MSVSRASTRSITPLNRRQHYGAAMLLLTVGLISGCLHSQPHHWNTSGLDTPPAPENYEVALSAHANDGPSQDRPMSRKEIQRREYAIDLAADYLVRAVGESGQFTYRINLDPESESHPRYNMLRHAGAMYALSMHHDSSGNAQSLEALQRSSTYLRVAALGPVPGRDDLLAIWSRPEIVGGSNPLQAKLGGAGLGLVAMTSAHRLAPDNSDLDDLRGLARFILFMQKPDGSFYSKYVPSKGGRQDKWTSLYYPGEAALGMIMLYEIDPDPRWLASARDALAYLARSRAGQESVPADHWALLATGRLMQLELDESKLPSDTTKALLDHVVQVVQSILSEQVVFSNSPLLIGGFSSDGRTTPTATRLEGLIAALQIVPRDQEDLQRHMQVAIQRGMSFLVNSQVLAGEYAGAVPRAIARWPEDGTDETATFNRRATEVRIDYVQHTLAAMIQYVKAYRPTTEAALGK